MEDKIEKKTKRVYFTCKKKLLYDGKVQQYCQCDGCFKVTSVNVMKFPKTCFYNGKDLTTKYTTRWYCDECVNKIHKAIVKNKLKYMFLEDFSEGVNNE